MDTLLLVIRLALAAVFAVAGTAKLRDLSGTRRATVDFGAPPRLAPALSVLLPVAELAVAALLLVQRTAPWGAFGALVLLAVFSAAVAVALARGQAPDCHCFGQLGAKPASTLTLVRNVGLAALAAVVALAGRSDPGPSAVAWIGDLDRAEAVAAGLGAALALALVLGGGVVAHVLRSHGRLLLRIESLERALAGAGIFPDAGRLGGAPEVGLPPGTPAPAVALHRPDGGTLALADLLAPGRPLLLLFTSPNCAPCTALFPWVREWQRRHAATLRIVLASGAPSDAVRAEAREAGIEDVYADPDLVAYEVFGATGTPSAVLIADDGTIASHIAPGADRVERLVTDAVTRPPESPPDHRLKVGEPLPDLSLPALDGTSVDLATFRGRDTVYLFWNPTCGFCRDMHGDLRSWEEGRNGNEPQLVIVSAGNPEEIAGEGFTSAVLVDREFAGSQAFGAGGTPMAIGVDADGRVRSRIVGGAPGVFALLGATASREAHASI